MMKPRFVTALVIGIGLLLAGPLSGQTPAPQNYDMTNPITLKGTVVGVGSQPDSPHAYILLDIPDAKGKVEQWAVEGDSAMALARAGVRTGSRGSTIRLGDTIIVIAYRPRADAKIVETVPTSASAVLAAAKAGRLVRGGEVTLPDGKKITWGASR